MLPFESIMHAVELARATVETARATIPVIPTDLAVAAARIQADMAPAIARIQADIARLDDWDLAQFLAEQYPLGRGKRYAGPHVWPLVEAELRTRAATEGRTPASVWRDAVTQAILLLARRGPGWRPAAAMVIAEALDGVLPGWRRLKAEAEQRRRSRMPVPVTLDADGVPEPVGEDEMAAVVEQLAWDALTVRFSPQVQVLLRLLDAGYSQVEVADMLGVAPVTVRTMTSRLRRKQLTKLSPPM